MVLSRTATISLWLAYGMWAGELGEEVGRIKTDPGHENFGYHMKAFGLYLRGCGSLKNDLSRIVELVGKWTVDRKIKVGEICWEIIGWIQVKDAKGQNTGRSCGDIIEDN